MILYHNQRPVIFILHSAELHIGISIRYENALYGFFLNCSIVKIIVISFNCFSEYIYTCDYHVQIIMNSAWNNSREEKVREEKVKAQHSAYLGLC